MSEFSRKFARYALEQTALCDPAMVAAKTFILDSLGVGIAGAKAPFSKAIVQTVQSWGAGGDAAVFGRDFTLPAASAAYLNGFQIHSMEYDCVHEPAVVHPMATILAALAAETARHKPLSGRAFIEAICVAVDVAVELGVAVTSPLKFFRPATAGLFGATLGIARLRGFDEDTAMSALGCALAQCAGVMQAHVEGKPTLPVQIAGAARAAIVACDLAQNGIHGPLSSLEGPYGYFAMFEDEADAAKAVKRLGVVRRITEVSWKPFPTGRAAQGGIVCVQKLLDKGVSADDITKLTLSAPPIIPRLVNRPIKAGMTPNYARLCFPYLGAITLLRGTVSLADYTDGDLTNAEILSLADKIDVIQNHVSDPAEFVPQTVTATLRNGETVTTEIQTLFGSPADPLTPMQHLEKFRTCLAFGLSEVNALRAAEGLIEAIDTLETASDIAPILALTRAG